MKRRKSQKRVKQCLDLVKLIRNRPRPQPYYFQRSSSNAGRSRRNESNCFCYNTASNFHRSCIFNCHNLHPEALASSHSSFHIPNCYSQIHSDCSSSEEISPKNSILSKPDVELFETESQITVLSYGLVNELSKLSNTTPKANTTPSTSKLPQEVEENASPSCSNNRKTEAEETTNELTPNDEVSSSESSAKSNETISAEVSNEENTLNASQSALEHETTTAVAEPNVSRQLSTDEEAGGDGHHNNDVIEIEITLLSGNDTNSEEEDEGDVEAEAEAETDGETPMPVESGE
ncbi:uncharacterized protein LOC109579479 [Bactrocera dorsalis]|uniref:Uncharacterized protein LOC109579479 n=1 Tax=Bactrocera dorsalis TaxID=27457 RepID=A0A9B6Q7L0_BACDO|nr:uncharacterized protein LOC109579479 [Bactrocera dorsalis]